MGRESFWFWFDANQCTFLWRCSPRYSCPGHVSTKFEVSTAFWFQVKLRHGMDRRQDIQTYRQTYGQGAKHNAASYGGSYILMRWLQCAGQQYIVVKKLVAIGLRWRRSTIGTDQLHLMTSGCSIPVSTYRVDTRWWLNSPPIFRQ